MIICQKYCRGTLGDVIFGISWKCGKILAEKCSGMGARKKFRILQVWLGVLGQALARPDFQVMSKTSKMIRNGPRIDGSV